MINIAIIFGSMTPEHDLSCKSAATILQGIDRKKYNPIAIGITREGNWYYTESTAEEIGTAQKWLDSPTNKKAMLDVDYKAKRLIIFEKDGSLTYLPIDCIFARIAGDTGEDGKLQGLFELTGIPYVGCGVMSSACSMDKAISNMFADSIGLRRPMTQIVLKKDYEINDQAAIQNIMDDLGTRAGFPIFVKPVSTGSSIGISKAHKTEELKAALDKAFQYGDKVILEEGITGTEIKVGVLGNANPQIGALCELIPNGDFNDFDTKYVAHSSMKRVPATFEPEIEEMIKEYTYRIYEAMECKGLSRIDFFLTEEKELVFNEINSMPGFQPSSVYPVLFEAIGMSYTELISKLIEFAMEGK